MNAPFRKGTLVCLRIAPGLKGTVLGCPWIGGERYVEVLWRNGNKEMVPPTKLEKLKNQDFRN